MAEEECVEPESSRVSGKGVTWARWKFRVHGNDEVATSVITRVSIIVRDWIFSKIFFPRSYQRMYRPFATFPFRFVLSIENVYISCASAASLTSNASLNLTVGGRRCSFAYIKVAVSYGKLLRWGFQARTAPILFEGFNGWLGNFRVFSVNVYFYYRLYLPLPRLSKDRKLFNSGMLTVMRIATNRIIIIPYLNISSWSVKMHNNKNTEKNNI